MSLWHKVRVLVGALAHKPFMPRPDKVDLDGGAERTPEGKRRREVSGPGAREPAVDDTERVADLIARQKRNEAG
jgi:hypothetical protein